MGVGGAIVQQIEKKVMERVVAGGVKPLTAEMVTTGLLHHVARKVIEVVTSAPGKVQLLLVVALHLILLARWLLSRTQAPLLGVSTRSLLRTCLISLPRRLGVENARILLRKGSTQGVARESVDGRVQMMEVPLQMASLPWSFPAAILTTSPCSKMTRV